MARRGGVRIGDLKSKLIRQTSIVMQEIEPELVEHTKESIDDVVYGAGTPSYYIRTGGFRDGLIGQFEVDSSGASVRLQHKENHFTPYQDLFTRRYYLRDANFMPKIVHEGLSGALYGNGFWRRPRPYLTHAKRNLENGKLESMFKSTYASLGGRLV